MEIIGINSEFSGPGTVALIVKPPITKEIFAKIREISITPLLSSLNFQTTQGLLIFHSQTVDEHIGHNIKVLLNRAEQEAQQLQDAKREQKAAIASTQKDQKTIAVNSAAKAFGVSVQ